MLNSILFFILSFKEVLFKRITNSWQQVKRHKFITNAGAYISGNFLQTATGFFLIPILARFLTPEDYGITGTMVIYSGFLTPLLVMGLGAGVVRQYFDYIDDLGKQKSNTTTIILFQIVVSGVIVILLNIWGPGLWERYTANTISFDPYVRIMLWTAFVGALLQIPLALYRAQQKAGEFVYLQYGRFLLGVVLSLGLVVLLQWGAYGVLMSQLLAGLVISAVAIYLTARTWFSWSFEWQYVRAGLAFGLPLVPHTLASVLLNLSDRVILERFVPLTELGLYNFGYTLGLVMRALVASISKAWSPHYFHLMELDPSPETKILRTVSLYVVLVGGVCLVGVLFTGEIVHILLPSSYYDSVPYVGPVLVGSLFVGFYQFANKPLYYFKKTKIIPLLTGITAALNISLNLWLIPLYGAIAAAWTTLVSYGFSFLISFLAGRRYQKINYPLIRYSLLVAIILLATLTSVQLGVFDKWALLIKITFIVVYGVLAYWLIIIPYVNDKTVNR